MQHYDDQQALERHTHLKDKHRNAIIHSIKRCTRSTAGQLQVPSAERELQRKRAHRVKQLAWQSSAPHAGGIKPSSYACRKPCTSRHSTTFRHSRAAVGMSGRGSISGTT